MPPIRQHKQHGSKKRHVRDREVALCQQILHERQVRFSRFRVLMIRILDRPQEIRMPFSLLQFQMRC